MSFHQMHVEANEFVEGELLGIDHGFLQVRSTHDDDENEQ